MSVVVRMEMPLNCLECPMYDWNRQKLCCNAHFDLRPIPNGGVPKPGWCPIICQLPEGHGRLVDATKIDFVMFTNEDSTFRCGWNNGVRSVMQHAETIVPAERREKDGR